MAIEKKIYAVEIGGKVLFVKGQTTRGAIKVFSAAMAREAEKTLRLVDAVQMLDIVRQQGAPVVIEGPESDGEPEPTAASPDSGATQDPAPAPSQEPPREPAKTTAGPESANPGVPEDGSSSVD